MTSIFATRRRSVAPPAGPTVWDGSVMPGVVTISGGGLVATNTAGPGFQPCIVNNAWLGDVPRYIEFVLTDPTASHFDLVGLAPSIPATYPGSTTSSWGYYEDDGGKYNNGTGAAYGSSYRDGDVIGIGFDGSSIEFFLNKVSQGIAFTGVSGTLKPSAALYSAGHAFTIRATAADIGTIPSGYAAWDP